jgi:LPXTG-motif cell wall-anchored protein
MPSVGGEWAPAITVQAPTPANTYQMLAPWITLASLVVVALTSFVYVKRKKKKRK